MPGFTLKAEDQALQVYVPFGESAPRALGGGAVIEEVSRPKRKILTEWKERRPFQLELSFKFSTFETGAGLVTEKKIRVLERMWGVEAGDPEPPRLIVEGDPPGSIPHDYHDAKHIRWWLEDIQEDEGTERNSSGNRIQMSGKILLKEVVEDDEYDKLGKKKSDKKKTKVRWYTVKRGDTLSKIAARYKIKGGYHTLMKLNNIRDPKRLKVGQKIRLS